MRRALLLSLMVLLPLSARAELVDRVAAVVNDDVIPMSEVQQRAAEPLAQIGQISDPTERATARDKVLKSTLDQLIGEKLIQAQEKDEGIVVTEGEIDAGIADVKKTNNFDDAKLDAALTSQGYTRASYREFLRKQIGQMRLIRQKVLPKMKITDADLKAEYERMKAMQSTEFEVHARHILIPLSPHAGPAEVEAAKKKAEAIALEARAPGADFATVAKQHNESPSASSGGDLGWFGHGTLEPAFERVAFALPVGQVSDPVRSRLGWHVIKVEEHRAVGILPFDQLKTEIQDKLQRSMMEKYTEQYVQELRSKALVEVKM